MFSTCQQLIDGIKLWAVSHVLMDIQDIGQNTEDVVKTGKTLGLNNKNADYKTQKMFIIFHIDSFLFVKTIYC